MIFEWPQIVFSSILVLGVGINLAKCAYASKEEGGGRTGKFFVSLLLTTFAFYVLYAGGFYGR